jgi:uncharacterized protein (UPF0335 family)
MAQSDTAAWAALVERVEKLEAEVKEMREGRELAQELYGEQPDHAPERAVLRRPGRPPGS